MTLWFMPVMMRSSLCQYTSSSDQSFLVVLRSFASSLVFLHKLMCLRLKAVFVICGYVHLLACHVSAVYLIMFICTL